MPLERHEASAMLAVLGGVSVLLGLLYTKIRHRLLGDVICLDLVFGAGGGVGMTLTAVSLVGHLLWPSSLVHSVSDTIRYGLSGGFWSALPISLNLLLFPLLSVHLKSRAPGAKTFLQLIHQRFSRRCHLLYCVFALLTNVVITVSVLTAGATFFKVVVKDISDEMIVIGMAAIFGSYSFIGGLGATFYVSYVNMMITLCVLLYLVTKVFYVNDHDQHDQLPFGKFDEIYNVLVKKYGNEYHNHSDAPGGSNAEDTSYLTYSFSECITRAVKGALLGLAVVCCDQAVWQNKIAAKSMQGVLGFLFASLIWLAMLPAIGSSIGVGYLAASNNNILTISNGSFSNISVVGVDLSGKDLVIPLLTDLVLGKPGIYALGIVFTMLIISTGSREVMAVSSIIVYDIYQNYIQPFRTTSKGGHCVLCGRPKLGEATETIFIDAADSYCYCPLYKHCQDCANERKMLWEARKERRVFQLYTCPTHGQYRAYQDSLWILHRWVILWVALGIIPLGMFTLTSGLHMNSILTFGSLVTLPAIPGIILSLTWVKATSQGLIAGSISGLLCGLAIYLARVVTSEDRLGVLATPGDDLAVVAGLGTGLVVSLCITAAVSQATHTIRTPTDEEREWQKLRDIDNPLFPWQQVMGSSVLSASRIRRPTFQELRQRNRSSHCTAWVGSCTLLVAFVLIIPGCLAGLNSMTSSFFEHWLITLHVMCFSASLLLMILTPAEETFNIWSTLKKKRTLKIAEETNTAESKGQSWVTGQRERVVLVR